MRALALEKTSSLQRLQAHMCTGMHADTQFTLKESILLAVFNSLPSYLPIRIVSCTVGVLFRKSGSA